eukprot:TRINITY_DN8227_c0_g1_i1.p1 TRINITY_DN8227_c0_g1~~TRINITY_DN8227_c0_g1_i1.p1  ORF type:complete len:628 (-),score=142.32 TRINITY_DN8227_c0_g1_i1:30-1913(-)
MEQMQDIVENNQHLNNLVEQVSSFATQDPKIPIALGTIASFMLLKKAFKIKKNWVWNNTVMELDITKKQMVEDDLTDIDTLLNPELMTWRKVLGAIETAKNDSKIRAILIRVDPLNIMMGKAFELREALINFQKENKKVIVYADTFTEVGDCNNFYYIASIADRIVISPSGLMNIVGFSHKNFFLKGTLDKLNIDVTFFKRRDYKNVANIFTETDMTEEHEEVTRELVSSISDMVYQDISQARGIPVDEVKQLFHSGPYLAHEALDLNLIDDIMYPNQIYKYIAELLELPEKKVSYIYSSYYMKSRKFPNSKGTRVALIICEGNVHRGLSSPARDGSSIGDRTVVSAIENATKDKKVQAILLRVNSGGGSYIASDQIGDAIDRAKEEGKKIIVSMVDVAASGGYFISQNADIIVSNPFCYTGSIGVVSGHFNTTNFFENKLGITFDGVHESDNSTLFSTVSELNDFNRGKLEEAVDYIYEDFKAKVAKGRNMTMEEVEEVAQGRVHLGTKALELGLVDKLGGLDQALVETRKLLELEEDADLQLKVFPNRGSYMNMLFSKKNSKSENNYNVGVVTGIYGLFSLMKNILKLSSAMVGISEGQMIFSANSNAHLANSINSEGIVSIPMY